jgi:hypothetical protein
VGFKPIYDQAMKCCLKKSDLKSMMGDLNLDEFDSDLFNFIYDEK